MSIPETDAHALYEVLTTLRESDDARSIQGAWEALLGCGWATPEFARRQGEVVGLLTSTIEQMDQLTQAQQNRLSGYIGFWWQAVVAPQHAWHGPNDMGVFITDDHLNFLGVTADLIATRAQGSSAAPRALESELDRLRADLDEWVEYLSAVPGLAQNLRIGLLQHLKHAIWILEGVELFGASRAITASQLALGGITAALPDVPDVERPKWQQHIVKLASVIGQAMRVVALVHGAVDGVQLFWNSIPTEDAGALLLGAGPAAGIEEPLDAL